MKNIKKLLALVLALAICAAFAVPALAEGDQTPDGGDTPQATGYKLIMNNAQPGHTYKLYQLLTGTVLPGGTNIPEGTLGDIKWGNSGFKAVDSEGKEIDAAKYAEENLVGKSAADIDTLIDGITSSFTVPYADTPEAVNGTITWEGLPGGYYVIVDETKGELTDEDPRSNVMAQVVGDTTITPKPESLIPDKGVKEALDVDAEYQRIINSEVGRVLDYKVTATVSVGTMNLNEYYWVALTDTMTKGHTYKADTAKLVVIGPDGKEISGLTLPSVEYVVNDDKSITLTVKKFDLKAELKKALGDNMPTIGNVLVQLTYQAVVNEDAIEIEVVNNEVTWSTDVSEKGENLQEGTPIDTTTYVYHLSGEKVDGEGNDLTGAEFTLEKLTKNDEGEVTGATQVTIYQDAAGKYYAWNNTEGTLPEGYTPVTGNVIVANQNINGSTGNNMFTVYGLAEGWYRLTETKTPDGYNTMAPLEIKIVPNTVDVPDTDPVVKKLTDGCTYEYKEATESTLVQIVNEKGSLLPSTGGIGTTIFYIVGAVLVVGAGVLLFTKRRTSN